MTSELLGPLEGGARVKRIILLPALSCQKSIGLPLAKVTLVISGKVTFVTFGRTPIKPCQPSAPCHSRSILTFVLKYIIGCVNPVFGGFVRELVTVPPLEPVATCLST